MQQLQHIPLRLIPQPAKPNAGKLVSVRPSALGEFRHFFYSFTAFPNPDRLPAKADTPAPNKFTPLATFDF